jgi:hypothetical protein
MGDKYERDVDSIKPVDLSIVSERRNSSSRVTYRDKRCEPV